MKVSIHESLRELIWWLKCHISISWDSEKNKNVDQHLLWVLCWKVQPADNSLHMPIILAALGWNSGLTGLPQPRNTGPAESPRKGIVRRCRVKAQGDSITIFLPPEALVHRPLCQRPPVAKEDPLEEALLSDMVGVDVAAKPRVKCPLRTLPIFCRTSESLPLAPLPAPEHDGMTKGLENSPGTLWLCTLYPHA